MQPDYGAVTSSLPLSFHVAGFQILLFSWCKIIFLYGIITYTLCICTDLPNILQGNNGLGVHCRQEFKYVIHMTASHRLRYYGFISSADMQWEKHHDSIISYHSVEVRRFISKYILSYISVTHFKDILHVTILASTPLYVFINFHIITFDS